jgi:hypothetical protein
VNTTEENADTAGAGRTAAGPAQTSIATSLGQAQAIGSIFSRAIDRGAERAVDVAWRGFRRFPYLGVATAVGLALGASAVVGVAELALAAGAGYVAFQIFRLDVPPSKALRAAGRVQQELGL